MSLAPNEDTFFFLFPFFFFGALHRDQGTVCIKKTVSCLAGRMSQYTSCIGGGIIQIYMYVVYF